eukprot:5545400-Alexandrium_andersonii.AAC.1
MSSNAPTRLERLGVVSCAIPPAPSRGGSRPPRPPPAKKRLWRVPEALLGGSGGRDPVREGAGGGAQETAPNRSEQ